VDGAASSPYEKEKKKRIAALREPSRSPACSQLCTNSEVLDPKKTHCSQRTRNSSVKNALLT
jgi:hypothetical protein